MKKVNWGIIGLGNIALKFASGFKNINNATLKSISSKNDEKLNTFKKDFKIEDSFCYNSYEEIIKNKDIDIIYIALPHSLHYEWILKCIEGNKKILVEKPATINLQQIEKVKDLVLEKKIFFAEGFMYRYHPQITKVIDLIKNSTIGNLVSMKSYFGMNILEKKNIFGFRKKKNINKKSRLFNKDLGGGVILDLGCYPVSFSLLIQSLISKKIDNIQILNKKKEFTDSGVDIDSYADIIFNDKFIVNIGASFKKNLGKKTEIVGDRGKLIIEDSWHGNPSKINISGENNYSLHVDAKENIFSHEIEFISECILEKNNSPKYPGMTIHDTLQNIKILDEWLN